MRLLKYLLIAALAIVPAPAIYAAGFLILAQPGSGVSFSLTFIQSAASTNTSLTTIDYGTISYGTGNTRVIAGIGFVCNASSSVTGVTIGGTALAHVASSFVQASTGVCLDIWESSASLAGTSGDVQVTYNQAPQWHSAVGLYNLQTNSPTAASAATGGATSGTSVSATPSSIPAGGGAIVVANTYNGQSITFTNATTDFVEDSASNKFTFGHTTVTGSSQTITATVASSDISAISVAAWGP